MGAALTIRTDLASPARLRRLARREQSPRTATRRLAIANALEGMSRAQAPRLETRPLHPFADERVKGAFVEGGSCAP